MSINITISPEKAVKAGARWRIVDGSGQGDRWLGSGEGEVVTGLEPRYYRIEFAPVVGWREPQALTVRNVDGFLNCKTVAYKPLSFYELGQIPPQTAWHDQSLEFMIRIDGTGAVDVSSDPKPEGELLVDPKTGLFRYKPALADKFPFSVTLACRDGKNKQTFEVTPMPILRPEVDVFGGRPVAQYAAPSSLETAPSTVTPPVVALDQGQEPSPPPMPISVKVPIVLSTFLETQPPTEPTTRPSSTAALRAMDSSTPTDTVELRIPDPEKNEAELFNNDKRATRNIRIIGENVILEKGLEPYDAIHGKLDIKCLDIYAETVIIRSPLHLPQTTVSIHARELRFEDQADSYSYLSTVPAEYTTWAACSTRDESSNTTNPAGDGLSGAKAGDVVLHIESCRLSDPSKKRFILVGGRGQNPGTGLDGQPGTKLEGRVSYGWGANMGNTGWMIVYGRYAHKKNFFHKTHHTTFGKKEWPTDGGPGEPAGTPGRGGDGGNLAATLDLASQADLRGGDCGERGKIYMGGEPGEPRQSVMVQSENCWVIADHFSRSWKFLEHEGFNYHSRFENGKDVWGYLTKSGSPALSPAGLNGSPGKVTRSGHPLSWLHPVLLNEILENAKESYLLGDLEAARKKIAEYAELLDIYQSLGAWNELDDTTKLELGRIRNEFGGLLARLDSHQDYFGYPAGWVPLLSFEVNRTIFDNEIDRAIDVLYLSYWLGEKAASDKQVVAALEQLQVKLKQEIEDLKGRYSKATEAVPELEAEAGRISNEINLLQEKLKNLEDELRQKAEGRLEAPWWKTGLKIAGKLCSVIPVYQPALGAVGGLMTLGADFDKDDPWSTITGVADVAAAFSQARLDQKKQEFESASKKVDTKSKEFKALESAKSLQKTATALSKGLEGVAGVIAEQQVPKSEVDALLLKLEAESKEFKQLSEEMATLLRRKMDFAQKLVNALQLVTEIPNVITANLLAIDSASCATAKGRNLLNDGRLAMHLSAMERRAKERLLKYHYYLAKSYEYRLLQRYQGQLDLNKVFDKMESLAKLNMQGEKPHQLSIEQFDSLKAVYQDMLSTIAEEIFTFYNEHKPEYSDSIRFNLTKDEIDRLNADESVSLNLMDLELFGLREENARIVDIEIEAPKVFIEGTGARHLAEVDLRFEHSGISQLRQGGRAIRFYHSAGESLNPTAWGARYHVFDKIITPIKPSAASDSLLRSLLKSDTADSIMLYSLPAAWANISVSRETKADSGTVIKIEDLRLKVSYDYTEKSQGVHILHIKAASANEELQPYFMLDRADLCDRRDGRGDFYRAYRGLPTKTRIVAQDHYGRWRFDHWTDQAGNSLGKSPCLEVNVDRDQVLRAIYIPAK